MPLLGQPVVSRRSLLAGAIAAPFAGACAPAATQSSGGPVQITFWSALRGSQPVVDAFNRSQNKIKVIFQQIPGGDQGGYAKLSNAARAGNAPDVCTIEYMQLPGFAIDGVATDITGLMSDRLRNQIVPQAWRLATFDSKTFAVPFDIEPMVMHYRKDLFDQYGLTVPRTWDEFAGLARKVRDKAPDKRVAVFATDGAYNVAAFAWQAGGQWFDISKGVWNVSMTDAPSRRIAEYWQKLVDDDLVWVNPSAGKQYDAQIGNSLLLVRFSGAWEAGAQMRARPKQKGQWAIAPLPQWDPADAVVGTQGGSTFAISKDSRHAEAAMEFIEWQVTQPDSLRARLTSGTSSAFPSSPALIPVGSESFDRAYYGGQDIYRLFDEEAKKIRDGWIWGPRMSATQRVVNDGFARMSAGGTIIEALRHGQSGTMPDLKALGLSTSEHSS